MANSVSLEPVENGFIVMLLTYDSSIRLIAHDLKQALDIIRAVEFKTTRPLASPDAPQLVAGFGTRG